MSEVRSSISLDSEGREHVYAVFSLEADVVTVYHTVHGRDLCVPIKVPVDILHCVACVLEDANKFLRVQQGLNKVKK